MNINLQKLIKAYGCILVLLGLNALSTSAQQGAVTRMRAHTDTLFINERKTVSLAFPEPLVQLDRGSADLLVQRVAMAENLVQLKAARPDFTETNLSVLTQGGYLHSFIVRYSAHPRSWLLEVAAEPADSTQLDSPAEPHSRFAASARQAMQRIDPSVELRQLHQQLEMVLRGIFIRDDQMYFHFHIRNHSYIPFDVGRLALTVQDRKQARRAASQELQVDPLFVLGQADRIACRSGESLVLVTPKITLPEGKYLQLQLWEQGGARHQRMRIKNKQLLKAIPLINY